MKNTLFRLMVKSKQKPIFGMVHLRPTPGSPNFVATVNSSHTKNINFSTSYCQPIINQALQEAKMLINSGFDGLILENMHDVPYQSTFKINPIVQSIMSVIGCQIRKEFPNIAMGIQMLSCGNVQAMSVAAAAGFDFIRCEGYVYGHLGDEGWVESCAAELTRYRNTVTPGGSVWIVADLKKKHCAHAVTQDVSLVQTAQSVQMFLADAAVVTGTETGIAPCPQELNNLKTWQQNENNSIYPILIGSGLSVTNISTYFSLADGFIVGSSLKQGGNWRAPLDAGRVSEFVSEINRLRKE